MCLLFHLFFDIGTDFSNHVFKRNDMDYARTLKIHAGQPTPMKFLRSYVLHSL